MIVVLDMVSHSHAWDWIKNKGNPQACTMNQNGTKFVDFIHGSFKQISNTSGKLRLKHAQTRLQTFIILNLQHTPGAGLPHTSTLHELFSWRSLSAGLMREWHIEKAGNEPDRAKVSRLRRLTPKPCVLFRPVGRSKGIQKWNMARASDLSVCDCCCRPD